MNTNNHSNGESLLGTETFFHIKRQSSIDTFYEQEVIKTIHCPKEMYSNSRYVGFSMLNGMPEKTRYLNKTSKRLKNIITFWNSPVEYIRNMKMLAMDGKEEEMIEIAKTNELIFTGIFSDKAISDGGFLCMKDWAKKGSHSDPDTNLPKKFYPKKLNKETTATRYMIAKLCQSFGFCITMIDVQVLTKIILSVSPKPSVNYSKLIFHIKNAITRQL